MVKGMHDIITSTGSQRRKSPTRFYGLAHMSIGRWISEGRGSSIGIGDSGHSFDVSKQIYKKPRQNPRITTQQYEPEIAYSRDVIEDYNGKGGLGVIIQFKGLSFLEGAFTKSTNNHGSDYGQDAYVHYAKVWCGKKEAFLTLSTIEDILEVKVVPQTEGIDSLFYGKVDIPMLVKVYDPSSMEVLQRNGLVVVSYQKIGYVDLHDKNPRIRSKNSFTIEPEEDIGALLERVKRDTSAFGINFQGDISSGGFNGRGISGRYSVHNREIIIYVDKKPPFVTFDFIKESLSKYFYKNE